MDELLFELSNLKCEFDIVCLSKSWLSALCFMPYTEKLEVFESYGSYNFMRMSRRGGRHLGALVRVN